MHSLFGCDYPIPAKLLEVYREFVPATSGLLASLVAIESHVSLNPGTSSWIEFLHLHFEIWSVLRTGIGLNQSDRVLAMTAASDLQGDSQIISRMLEPLRYHSSELDRDPATPPSKRSRVFRGQRRTQHNFACLCRSPKNPVQRDRHRTGVLINWLTELRFLIHTPYPQRQLCPGNTMLDNLIGKLEIQHLRVALRVP